ncbi:hypothetical protein [Caldalkalibacillus salinus]|uniref:hypothetical protein n=1 Tax=Caldalkalibacillus salinus TaxID=2803787 RepID=UPI00192420E0|nr:hypothetical protein [Caldalkalibacillus salinus]
MDRFAQGSKDIVRSIDGKATIVSDSSLLNQRSIDDLTHIRNTMGGEECQNPFVTLCLFTQMANNITVPTTLFNYDFIDVKD